MQKINSENKLFSLDIKRSHNRKKKVSNRRPRTATGEELSLLAICETLLHLPFFLVAHSDQDNMAAAAGRYYGEGGRATKRQKTEDGGMTTVSIPSDY